jgi:hypothetical protein
MDAKSYFMELSFSCPFHKALDNCSLCKLREVPLTKLIEINNQLSVEDIKKMIHEHKNCIQNRLEKLKVNINQLT